MRAQMPFEALLGFLIFRLELVGKQKARMLGDVRAVVVVTVRGDFLF